MPTSKYISLRKLGFLTYSNFRYTVPNSAPENCYLSDRDYKELDYYTDLEPDRDCDIYTMNNRNKCGQTTALERYNSGKHLTLK